VNKDRRKEIQAIATRITEELAPLIEELTEALGTIRDEEQEYFDNMPESFQMGDKGTTAEEAISNLENAISGLEDLDTDSLESYLSDAQA
jgi:hypothetical protein